MAAPKTRPTDVPVDAYIEAQPEARRADCRALVALMSGASGAPPVIWGRPGIVGFGSYPLTMSDGKVNTWPRISFASRKQDLTLYVIPDEVLYAKLGPHKSTNACLYLKRLADVDEAVLAQIVSHSLSVLAERYGPQ